MFKNVLQSIDNIAVWPLVSFMIFFIFFVVLLWWVFTADNDFIARMKKMPMDEESDSESTDYGNGKEE